MCLYKQDSEYASGPKYAKILNMEGFSICERYIAFSIYQKMPRQSSEYILGSKCTRILNMAGSGYARVTQGSKYTTIWLKMSKYDVNMPECVNIQ